MDKYTSEIGFKPPDCKEDDWAGLERLRDILFSIQAVKPNDRSERDKRYAVTITMLEQALAYFHTYVVHHE